MVCEDKYIFCKKKALSKEECKQIIGDFEIGEKYEGPENEVTIRDNEFYYDCIVVNIAVQFWVKYLYESIEEYKTEHTFLGFGGCGSWATNSLANIQKYKPNQCYKVEHCEHQPTNSNRVLAWMIYLNTVNKGGGTNWPQQKFSSKAIAGDLYIWPASWTHSHKGIVAPEEEKYILTGWSSFVDST